jgi:predicted porin
MTPGIVVGHLQSRDPGRWRCADKRSSVLVGAQKLYNNVDTGWTTLSLINSWANVGGGDNTAAIRLQGNIVRLRGAINGGASLTAPFVVPVGFRPPTGSIAFPILAFNSGSNTNAGGFLSVTTAGAVVIGYGVGTNQVFLEGIAWAID